MDLFLVRHGHYKTVDQDPQEGLSDRGYMDIRNLAKFLTETLLFPQYILCSAKKRSWETAELLKRNAELIQTEKMRGDTPPEETLAVIPEGATSILLVGHLPNLQNIAKYFGADIDLDMGSIAYFQSGRLQWLLTPHIVRMLV